MREPRLLPAGDSAIVVEFGDTIDPQLNHRVRQFCLSLTSLNVPGIIEAVPTYRSALVQYDPLACTWAELSDLLLKVASGLREVPPQRRRVTVLPTLYGGEKGPDLPYVASYTGLSAEEVIALHSGPAYLVYMLGFTPGYPYMGGLDPKLAVPRLATPRLKTPAGSVGIGGAQTGVYTLATPGGFHIIGHTPVRLFDPDSTAPFLLEAGNFVRFRSVCMEEYLRVEQAVGLGTYKPEVHDE